MKMFTFAWHAKVPGSIPLAKDFCVLEIHDEQGNCVRVVKELVLKANALCPREFKSRRCRFFFLLILVL